VNYDLPKVDWLGYICVVNRAEELSYLSTR